MSPGLSVVKLLYTDGVERGVSLGWPTQDQSGLHVPHSVK